MDARLTESIIVKALDSVSGKRRLGRTMAYPLLGSGIPFRACQRCGAMLFDSECEWRGKQGGDCWYPKGTLTVTDERKEVELVSL